MSYEQDYKSLCAKLIIDSELLISKGFQLFPQDSESPALTCLGRPWTYPGVSPGVPDDPVLGFGGWIHPPASHRHNVIYL